MDGQGDHYFDCDQYPRLWKLFFSNKSHRYLTASATVTSPIDLVTGDRSDDTELECFSQDTRLEG